MGFCIPRVSLFEFCTHHYAPLGISSLSSVTAFIMTWGRQKASDWWAETFGSQFTEGAILCFMLTLFSLLFLGLCPRLSYLEVGWGPVSQLVSWGLVHILQSGPQARDSMSFLFISGLCIFSFWLRSSMKYLLNNLYVSSNISMCLEQEGWY